MGRALLSCLGLSVAVGCTATAPEAAPAKDEPALPVVESFEITIGESHTTADGLSIELRSTGHKHKVGGGSTSMWTLLLSKDGTEHSATYSYSSGNPRWYFEGYAAGKVFAVEELFALDDERRALTQPEELKRNQRRRVTLIPHPGPAPDPATLEERALALAAAEVDGRGCEQAMASGYSTGSGVLRFSRTTLAGKMICRVLVGLYTGTVFYQAAEGPLLVTRPPAP